MKIFGTNVWNIWQKISKLIFSEKRKISWQDFGGRMAKTHLLRPKHPTSWSMLRKLRSGFSSPVWQGITQLNKKHQLDHFQGIHHPSPTLGNLTIWSREMRKIRIRLSMSAAIRGWESKHINAESEGPRWLWRDLRACSNPLLPTPAKVKCWENNPILTEFRCQIEHVLLCWDEIAFMKSFYQPQDILQVSIPHTHTHEFVDVWSDFVTNSNSWTRNPIIFCTLARQCWICSNMIWWLLLVASNMFQNDCMYKQQGRSQACRSRCPENGWLFVGLLKWLSSLCPGTVCIKTQLGQAITESGRYTLCDVDALTTLRPRSNTSQIRKHAKGKGKGMVITMIRDW